jgi:hypothetical protein
MAVQIVSYPVMYDLDRPERLSRWLWLFKWLLLIPHFIILWVLSFVAAIALFVAWIVVIITAKYPRGLFDFIVGVSRWSFRMNAYGTHMTDRYPPFSMGDDPQYPVRIQANYPERSSRLKAFFRWLLIIPHLIVLYVLGAVNAVLWLVHIVIVIVTGKPNNDVFRIMVGINRWSARVALYGALTTDQYPPFALE